MKIEFLEEGSIDCPLVRIYGTETTDFVSLFRAVHELGDAAANSIPVYELPGFHGVLDCTLAFASSERDQGVQRSGRTLNFVCRFTPEKWLLIAGLIEPFTLGSRDEKYQWLSSGEARYGLNVGAISLLLSFSASGMW